MEPQKKTHSIGGIILVILSILAALFLCMILGAVGGGIAVLLALIALLLGLNSKRKGGKGLGVVFMSVAAILLAGILSFTAMASIREIHRAAVAYGDVPLLEKYSQNPALGMMGIVLNAGKDGADAEQLAKELALINERITESGASTSESAAQ